MSFVCLLGCLDDYTQSRKVKQFLLKVVDGWTFDWSIRRTYNRY